MILNGGEAFGVQVVQIVVGRRGPQRAYSLVGERGPQKPGREIPGSPGNRGGGVRISWGGVGRMGAEGPSSIWNHSSRSSPGQDHARRPWPLGVFTTWRARPSLSRKSATPA